VTQPEVLSDRALGRALLARQLLLHRVARPALEVVEHLVGLQAQEPEDPYVALWSRLAGFDPDELGRALLDRRAVRIALQRSTIHLVTARDCLALRPVLGPAGERLARGQFGRRLAGVDRAELAAAARELLEQRPMTFGELGSRLAERWPDRDPLALAQTSRTLVPLVQLPPRGVWGRSGRALHVSVESWLGRPVGADTAPDPLVLRYLAAFGPATVADVQNWSGLTRLGEVMERLAPRLRTFRAEDGRMLHDLPDAPRPPADTPAPVRFLPEYDNVLLGHADRSRLLPPGVRQLWQDPSRHWSSYLVDGRVRGTWWLERSRGGAALHLRALPALSAAEEEDVTREAAALLDFLAPAASGREVRLAVDTT
jgi:Winged helix DNA-binding domain